MRKSYTLALCLGLWLQVCLVHAQSLPSGYQETIQIFNPDLYLALQWRNIGPFRGGRSAAVTGVPGQPLTYYMGSAGGGVWKTEDGGQVWSNVSDGYFATAAVGALAVAPSNPEVVYAGMGEHVARGVMTTHGDGIYKSEDGGRSWMHLNLIFSRHIAAIEIHPTDPETVYVAVQGALFGPSKDRGIYKTEDGGRTWSHILFINETSGAADLSMDPTNPDILFAAIWDHQRTPWDIRSGGPGSGIYKSVDGGQNWQLVREGLPEKMGKIGIDISPADPDRIYAVIEAEEGGVFRSDDGGNQWTHLNAGRETTARAWYYCKIIADPQTPETVYVLNNALLKSTDGGNRFTPLTVPHVDQHALWINPSNPRQMILGNDGGATISLNGGKTWSSQNNQPTAQLYRLTVDNQYPSRVYAGQQDNTTISIPERSPANWITERDWHPVGGGESGFIALDPDNPKIVYSGNYLGQITRFDQSTHLGQDIMALPGMDLGRAANNMAYRFNWNAPIVLNPHNPQTLYHAANVVLKSSDQGKNWLEISPDLTRNEPEKQKLAGGPFTVEGAGVEVYNTISYLAVSPQSEHTIWVGTDDGKIHLTKDEGASWQDITPPVLPECIINSIELSPFQEGTAWIAAHRYKFNDFTPMIYRTDDFGKSWQKCTNGIPSEDFVRVVRQDPVQPDLLFAGTETGLYISVNGGKRWYSFQLNLPTCPITDLKIHQNDLIAATAGRSFWILDELTALRQTMGTPNKQAIIFTPSPAIRQELQVGHSYTLPQGENPAPGMIIDYFIPLEAQEKAIQISIFDQSGTSVRAFKNDPPAEDAGQVPMGQNSLLAKRWGINRLVWDLRRTPFPTVPGQFIYGDFRGAFVPPGQYVIALNIGDSLVSKTTAIVLPDPRLDCPLEAYEQQEIIRFALDQAIREIHLTYNQVEDARHQLEQAMLQLDESKELYQRGEQLIKALSTWQGEVVEEDLTTFQEAVSYPLALSAQLMDLYHRADTQDPRISEGIKSRTESLLQQWEEKHAAILDIFQDAVKAFNRDYCTQNPSSSWKPLLILNKTSKISQGNITLPNQ